MQNLKCQKLHGSRDFELHFYQHNISMKGFLKRAQKPIVLILQLLNLTLAMKGRTDFKATSSLRLKHFSTFPQEAD